MNWYSISNATIIALSKEVIYNFERDDLLNHTAFSGHRTPRFALRAKTMCDSIRVESGLRMILILGWLISKSLLGWVGLKLYTNLFALNPTQAAFYSDNFLHGAYWIYCNRSVKMCSVSTTECCKRSAVLKVLCASQYCAKWTSSASPYCREPITIFNKS